MVFQDKGKSQNQMQPFCVWGRFSPFFVKQTKKLSLKCSDCAKLTEKGAGKLGIL